MRTLLFLLAFLLAQPVLAEPDTRYAVYGLTHHLTGDGHNDHHPMIQIEHRRRWVGGVYLNSASRWSWYGAARLQSDLTGRPFLEIGGVTGYGAPVVRSLRIGAEINRHLDVLFMPGFAHTHSFRITDPVSVIALVVKI